jgi:hypothetical protein
MFKFQLILPKGETVVESKPILQVMQLFAPHLIASGDIVLYKIENPQWQTVETVYVDNEEYDKARGWKMPEPCEGKDVEV